MTPERYRLVQRIFEQVCDVDHPKRMAAIERACNGDMTLHREVVELLAHDGGEPDTDACSDPRIALGAPRSSTPVLAPMPERIGSYRIVRFVGAGGMGMVFQAEQDAPKRTVALKLLNPGLTTAEMVKRFRREVHVLGLLHHPGIAQVHDAGTADPGEGPRAFFVMEFVEGEPILEWARRRKLGTRARLELVARLCEAVQHAHTKGVVHRDLKPGNILVTSEGQPKILDFGVARLTRPELRATTLRTEIGQLIGTIPYMSPEQASGNPDEIDTRCDVYALGVLLYELLAERPPYELEDCAVAEALRIIREETPRPLSAIDRSLRGDVETIVATALAKDKTRRYQTASSLADDIRRHLRDEPISARPPSALYQMSKLVRRHRVPCALALALLLTSIAFGVIGTVQAHYLREANSRAEKEAEEKAHQLYCSQIAQANMLYNDQNLEQLAAVLDACDPNRRGWEWRWLKGKARPAGITVLDGDDPVVAVAPFGEDLLVIKARDFAAHSARTGRRLFTLPAGGVRSSAVSIASGTATIATGDDSGQVSIYEEEERAHVFRLDETPVAFTAFCRNGERVVATGNGFMNPGQMPGVARTAVAVFDLLESKVIRRHEMAGMIVSCALSDRGEYLAIGNTEGALQVLQVADDELLAELQFDGPISALAFTADNDIFFGVNGYLARVKFGTNEVDDYGREHDGNITAIAINAHSNHVATIAVGLVVVRDIVTKKVVLAQPAHSHPAGWVVSVPQSDLMCTWSYDGRVRLWAPRMATTEEWTPIAAEGSAAAVDIESDLLVATDETLGVVVCDLKSGEVRARLSIAASNAHAVAIDAAGRVLIGGEDGVVRRWDFAGSGAVVELVGHRSAVTAVEFDRVGGRTVSCSASEVIAVDAVGALSRHDTNGEATALAVGAGGLVVVGCADGTVWEWRIEAEYVCVGRHADRVTAIAVRPDGGAIASAADGGDLIVWSRDHDGVTRVSVAGTIHTLAWTADSARLFSAGLDTDVRIWHGVRGELLLVLQGVAGEVYQLWHAARPDDLIVRCNRGVIKRFRTAADVIAAANDVGAFLDDARTEKRVRETAPLPEGGGAFWRGE